MTGVIRFAILTFQPQKVEGDVILRRAVVAGDETSPSIVRGGERLGLYLCIERAELAFHIYDRPCTRGTAVRILHMFVIAFMMNRMTTTLFSESAQLWLLANQLRDRKRRGQPTMKTTVSVDVNMYSPHIGQSHSVERSIHLCDPSRAIDMHTPHF